MSVVERKTRRNNETNRRDELLRVSAKLFREKGFDGTTIRDISSAAGSIFHEKSSGFAPAAAAKAIFK